MFGWIHNHVGAGQEFETRAPFQESREDRATVDAELTRRRAGAVAAAHIVAGHDECGVGSTKLRKCPYEHVDALPGGELSEVGDDRAVHVQPLAKLPGRESRLELV